MRQPFVAGNWKMNGSKQSIETLLEGLKGNLADISKTQIAVCAPFVYLNQVQAALNGGQILWGAQNVSHEPSGAFTGEVAVDMLKDFACGVVIVGHSERRSLYGESDEVVAKKFSAVRAGGMKPILCVGESLDEREQNITEQVVARQLDAVIDLEGVDALAEGIIAYEPVWAIGTGKTATPEQAQDVHAFIRKRIAEKSQAVADKVQILYGGSMNAANAAELLAMADIDGGLIGGASLKADDFSVICHAAENK